MDHVVLLLPQRTYHVLMASWYYNTAVYAMKFSYKGSSNYIPHYLYLKSDASSPQTLLHAL
jgi:hypothetical protein